MAFTGHLAKFLFTHPVEWIKFLVDTVAMNTFYIRISIGFLKFGYKFLVGDWLNYDILDYNYSGLLQRDFGFFSNDIRHTEPWVEIPSFSLIVG